VDQSGDLRVILTTTNSAGRPRWHVGSLIRSAEPAAKKLTIDGVIPERLKTGPRVCAEGLTQADLFDSLDASPDILEAVNSFSHPTCTHPRVLLPSGPAESVLCQRE
jgi:hypothetical protein